MVAKPSPDTILKTYSLEEMLDLVKQKSELNANNQLDEFKKHIESFTSAEIDETPMQDDTPRVGRPVGSGRGRKKAGRPSASASTGRKKSLGEYLLETIGSQPMKVEEIMSAIEDRGYKSKSKDPRRILYLELKKQVESGALKKAGRGLYKQ